MAELIKRGADGIFQGQAQRHYDFRRGNSLGKKKHLVRWVRPALPRWMSKETYDLYPETIEVREFKVKGKVYVTTLLNHKKHDKKDIADLYKLRWQVEINLRSIKSVLGMDHLSCKTPEMITKEVAAYLLGYNIIRIMIAEACCTHNAIPNKISFKGTVQILNQFMPRIAGVSPSEGKFIYKKILSLIVLNVIGKRPGRIEPRAIKRRPKAYPRLTKSRCIERDKIIKKQKRQCGLKNACA